MAAIPVVLSAAGFTTAGIAAGCLAAKGMYASTVTGVGTDVMSGLQAAGVAGVGAKTASTVGLFAAWLGRQLGGCLGPNRNPEQVDNEDDALETLMEAIAEHPNG